MSEVLNEDVIGRLLAITGREDADLLLDLITLFLEDAPARLRDIREALARGDTAALLASAHALRGTSGTLGLDDVRADCAALAAAPSATAAAPAIAALEHHLEQGVTALEGLRQQYT